MSDTTMMDFGPFLLRRLIFSSAIFDLWHAESREDGSLCLIRRMLPPYTQGQAYVDLFEERCKQAETLDNSSLLQIEGQGIFETIPYARLEALHGWNLQELLNYWMAANQNVPIEHSTEIGRTVATALKSLHETGEGFVHGALRPESIWIRADGEVKLGDLEIGALAEVELHSAGSNPDRAWRFTPPEREENWENPRLQADIFSLGAIMLELLVVGRLSMVQMKLPSADQLPLLPNHGVPSELVSLISSMLSPEAGHRPSAAEVLEKLDKICNASQKFEPLTAFLSVNAPMLQTLASIARRETTGAEDTRKSEKAEESGLRDAVELPAKKQRGPLGRNILLAILVIAGVGLMASTAVMFWPELFALLMGPGADMAMVNVESEPGGATIVQPNGKELGQTPLRMPVHCEQDGSIVLIAKKFGYESQTIRQDEVPMNGAVEFEFTLRKREAGPGTLQVNTEPAGATVVVDGQKRGSSPTEVSDLLSSEPHKLELRLKGYMPHEQEVAIVPGEVNEVSVTLEQAKRVRRRAGHRRTAASKSNDSAPIVLNNDPVPPPDPGLDPGHDGPVGYLLLKSTPWAHVIIDGSPRGATDTGRRVKVTPGKHDIVLRSWDKGEKVQNTIHVRGGQTRVMNYDFIHGGWRIEEYRPF